jgi:hypothetical protein
MRRICTVVCTLLVMHVTRLAAQIVIIDRPSFNDAATFLALARTSIGGLPPIATSTILGDVQSGVALSLRYGHVGGGDLIVGPRGEEVSLNNFGATAIVPMGMSSTISLTGGVSAPTTGSSSLMLSIGGDTRLGAMPLSQGRGGARLNFGLNGELGYGKPSGASLVSAEVGLPISLVPGPGPRDAMRIVPFLTPAFTFSNFNPDDSDVDSESGAHFMLGGGIALYNRSSTVAFNVGFQYMAISGASTEFGLALTLGGR